MATEVVHHNDVAWFQRGHQELLDIGLETLGVDRSVQKARGMKPIAPQGRDKGQGLAMTVRDLRDQALSNRASASDRGHVRLGPGLIDENQSSGIDLMLMGLPLLAPARDVRAVLFAGVEAFF